MLHFTIATNLRGTLSLLLTCTLIALALAQNLGAAGPPVEFTKFDAAKIKDLTLDASYGSLYFRYDGKNYVYTGYPANGSIDPAELFQLIGKASRLLIEEMTPAQAGSYYDNRTAQKIKRILIQIDPAEKP